MRQEIVYCKVYVTVRVLPELGAAFAVAAKV